MVLMGAKDGSPGEGKSQGCERGRGLGTSLDDSKPLVRYRCRKWEIIRLNHRHTSCGWSVVIQQCIRGTQTYLFVYMRIVYTHPHPHTYMDTHTNAHTRTHAHTHTHTHKCTHTHTHTHTHTQMHIHKHKHTHTHTHTQTLQTILEHNQLFLNL